MKSSDVAPTSGPTTGDRKLPLINAQTPSNGRAVRKAIAISSEGDLAVHLPVAVLLDNIRSMYNVGALFRAADGVRLQKLWLCGITAHPPKKAISKTALGAEEVVRWEHDWDALKMADALQRKGYELAAIETSPRAIDLFEWEPRFPVCVAFGNEVEGLQPRILQIADAHVRLPMLGHKTSLNVATAAGIVLYELLRKYRSVSKPRYPSCDCNYAG